MIVSVNFLSLLVLMALGITIIAPVALVFFWIKDWKGGKLW